MRSAYGQSYSYAVTAWSATPGTGPNSVSHHVDGVDVDDPADAVGRLELAGDALRHGVQRVAVAAAGQQVEAVLAHEVSHVANGDMVTMALIQGVVNTFVVFLSRLVGFFVDRVILKNERGLGIGYFISSIIAQIVLGILATTIVMWFSRRREYRADAGGAQLAGRHNMIGALKRLQTSAGDPQLAEGMQAFGIHGAKSGIKALFLSHPPLEQRIAALQASNIA